MSVRGNNGVWKVWFSMLCEGAQLSVAPTLYMSTLTIVLKIFNNLEREGETESGELHTKVTWKGNQLLLYAGFSVPYEIKDPIPSYYKHFVM